VKWCSIGGLSAALACVACGGPDDATADADDVARSNPEGATAARGRGADDTFQTAAPSTSGTDGPAIERSSSSATDDSEADSTDEDPANDASTESDLKDSDSGSSQTSGASSLEPAGDGLANLSTDACPDAVGSGKDGLIDNLEDGDGALLRHDGRSGYWYAYSDGSGTQTPPAGTTFLPGFDGAGGSSHSASTFGNGFTGWGAGIGFDLTSINRCEYDASLYKGLAFWAKGNVTIRSRVAVKQTTPLSQGGGCDAMPQEDCNNAHGVDVALNSSWTLYKIPFSDMKQEDGWGVEAKFNAKEILKIQFQVKSTSSDQQGIPDFNYAVDDVAFY